MTKREAAGGMGARARQAAGAADGLVGRGDVLARLGRAVDDAVAGHGGLVLLTGEAGIGKTTVAARAAAEAERRGVLAVWGWGWQGEGAPAYWPWVQVLRSLAARDGRLLRQAAEAPSLARLLPELPGAAATPPPAEAPPAAARFQLFDELSSALLAASEERPLAVILDDLQWADLPSVQLLDFLTRRLPAARMLVLGTYRDADQPPHDPAAALLAELAVRGTVLPLAGLSEEEVALVLAGILGAAPAPALVANVRRRTGGNPFFVQQVSRLLLAQSGSPNGCGRPARPGSRSASARRSSGALPGCADPARRWSPPPPWWGRSSARPCLHGSPAGPPAPCVTCSTRPCGRTS
jgi:predicted ATPase